MRFVNIETAHADILVPAKALYESARHDPKIIFGEYESIWKEICKVFALSELIIKKSDKEKAKYRFRCEEQIKAIPEMGKKILIMKTAYELCKFANAGTEYGDIEYRVVIDGWYLLNDLEKNFNHYLDLIDGKPIDPKNHT